ncbi:MFS transporter [Streptosporangium saharense]|uniref:MFS family permease n=1 Tax=Streptosporangium saharense TaxID=1706840 RepID=A0A7W7QMY3_9ACTN|nr:MFS transporter [Streptosporangium saharense]MBB4916537.1 MFS family permease [Streptosporangium saharense]
MLSTAQIVSGIGTAVGFSLSSLVVAQLSGSVTISGLAGTATVLGAALLALPTARTSGKGGRRAGLALAYGCALLGCVITVVAITVRSWPLLLGGLVLFGSASAGSLASRYSATDLSPPGHTARHLSWVVWAATIGSVAGPNLAEPAERLGRTLGLAPDTGPFALSLVAFAVALVVILAGLRPDPLLVARSLRPETPTEDKGGNGTLRTAWQALSQEPTATRALAAIAVSHTAMVSIMSMTPVHLGHGGASYSVIGIVLSLHIAGMYILSPVVGWLADRIGRVRVLVLGMALLLAAAVLAGGAGPHDVARVTTGLTLLGLGWSCGLISGSAMLSEAVRLEHRPAVQGMSDLLMNVCGAVGAVLAGVVVGTLSYGVLGAIVAVMVTVTGAWLALRPAHLASA